MKLNISILFILLFLSALSIQANSATDFKVEKLSNDGKLAYNILFSAKAFKIGSSGWVLRQSVNEIALRILLREKKAKEALISLIHNASPEGSLYGLFGLKMNSLKTFNKEMIYYKSKPEPPERSIDAASFKIPAGSILLARSDVLTDMPIPMMIQFIERGDYDETFLTNKRGLNDENQINFLKAIDSGVKTYVKKLDLSQNEIITGCRPSITNENKTCQDNAQIINVNTLAQHLASDPLTYYYTITGGKIIGQGAKVQWDLSGVKAGTYAITAAVDNGCGFCGKTMTKTVVVKECPDCN